MTEKRFALLLGNSLYDNPGLAQLSAPNGDASDFAAILKDDQIGAFDEAVALINQPASEIRKSVARFFTNRSRDDLLLLYFSGHGVLDDRGKLYLAARDTEPDLLSATAIDAAFVTDAMDRSHSNRQVLILDCCHSGAFARGAKGVVGSSVGTATAFEGTGSGRVILTATDATQYAWEGDQVVGKAENSVFTRYLIEGLRSGQADLNGDGWVTLDEWYDYVYDRVIDETPRQTPAKWSYKQQGEIWVGRNPNPAPKKQALPQELQDTLADPRSWVREGAVAELDRLMRTNPGLAGPARAALETLVHDDSRRVSTAAQASLSAYESQAAPPGASPVLASVQPRVSQAEPQAELIPQTGAEAVLDPAGSPALQTSSVQIASTSAAGPVWLRWPGLLSKAAAALTRSPVPIVAVAWCLGWFLSLNLALTADVSAVLFVGWALAGLLGDLALGVLYKSTRLTRLPLLALGWPLSLLPILFIFQPLYYYFDSAGSDLGRAAVVAGSLLAWMMLAGLTSALKMVPVRSIFKLRRAILITVLCWGAVFLVTLALAGTTHWEIALYRLVNDYPSMILDNFSSDLNAYYALSLNGILTGLVGLFAWSRLSQQTQ